MKSSSWLVAFTIYSKMRMSLLDILKRGSCLVTLLELLLFLVMFISFCALWGRSPNFDYDYQWRYRDNWGTSSDFSEFSPFGRGQGMAPNRGKVYVISIIVAFIGFILAVVLGIGVLRGKLWCIYTWLYLRLAVLTLLSLGLILLSFWATEGLFMTLLFAFIGVELFLAWIVFEYAQAIKEANRDNPAHVLAHMTRL